MNLPTLQTLLSDRDQRLRLDLERTRQITAHPVEKGDLSENIWLEVLNEYLPERYQARKAFIIDSSSRYSQQIDIVIHDRFYEPFVFKFGGYQIVPVESVYAAFEVKQTVTSENMKYDANKMASVRMLSPAIRATSQVPHPSALPIITGLLATVGPKRKISSSSALAPFMLGTDLGRLDFVCAGSDELHISNMASMRVETYSANPISQFVFRLFSAMQNLGTVPPIDIESYLASI